jgi:hypothetical protein
MNYFPTPHERPYGEATNLRTSYCHFPTIFFWALLLAQCLIARSARGDVRWGAAVFVGSDETSVSRISSVLDSFRRFLLQIGGANIAGAESCLKSDCSIA